MPEWWWNEARAATLFKRFAHKGSSVPNDIATQGRRRMSSHSEEFMLHMSMAGCQAACERAASSAGWRITDRQATSIVCVETPQLAMGFTNPAQVTITLASAGSSTHVKLDASSFGFGPFQSNHVKEQAQQLRGQIEAQAGRPSEPEAVPGGFTRSVFINGVRLSDEQLHSIDQTYRVSVPDGHYWYDRACGAWGMEGGPQAGVAVAGLDLGGPLRPDASNGNTGVFVNGRELHALDVQRLGALVGNVIPGRWWVDAQGNFGPDGWPMVGNLFMIGRAHPSGEVVSQSGWLVSDGSGFIGFQGSIGSGVSASSGS
jgi:hypothetical protein